MFRKILIANRGEIAVRVVRACRAAGIRSVAVYSEADRAALHVRLADEAVAIGPAAAAESYLRIDHILDAARRSGAQAIHPGYGFLSENACFARACAEAGFVFIGPPPAAMDLMGSKVAARRAMRNAGVPVVPGTSEPLGDAGQAATAAREIGYPVMLKASAGGGGKGMRLVRSPDELRAALPRAIAEAENAFGDGGVYLEKAIENPRHIEVQVMADNSGRTVHLFERECSLQRRHQKVVEEAPSPFLAERPEVRERLAAAAVQAAQAAGYFNAGTVEFLVDSEGGFYFLEMNTRLQVEHPVTELVSGIDLVREQIAVAAGQPLSFLQDDLRCTGAAVELRVYAEDPRNQFFPSPGRIASLTEPSGPGLRLDSGVYPGWTVPNDYDPLLAKLCAWGRSRDEAISRLRAALEEYQVLGVKTNLEFFRGLLADPRFLAGDFDTGFIERFLERGTPQDASGSSPEAETAALVAAAQRYALNRSRAGETGRNSASAWKLAARQASLR